MKLALSQRWWLKQKQRACILRRCFLKYPQWEFKPCRLSIFHIRTNICFHVFTFEHSVFFTSWSLHVPWMSCIHFIYIIHQDTSSKKTRALSKGSHKIVWTYWRSITTQTIFSDIQIRGVWWRWFTWLKLVNLPVLAEEDARTDRLKSMRLCEDARARVCKGTRFHCSSDQHSPQTLSTNPNVAL